MAALRAHATQIPPDSWLHSLAAGFGGELSGVEHLRARRRRARAGQRAVPVGGRPVRGPAGMSAPPASPSVTAAGRARRRRRRCGVGWSARRRRVVALVGGVLIGVLGLILVPLRLARRSGWCGCRSAVVFVVAANGGC